MTSPKKKLIILIIGLIVFSLIGNTVYVNIKHRELIKVTISVIPDDSMVKIDNGTVKAGANYVKPGTHVFEASKPGFETNKVTMEIQKKNTEVFLDPAPASEEAKEWLRKNPKIQRQREALGGTQYAQVSQNAGDKYPLIKQLPHIDRDFRVDYGQPVASKDKVTPLAIYVRASSAVNRSVAVGWIKQQGFDTSDYEIIFRDEINPLRSAN